MDRFTSASKVSPLANWKDRCCMETSAGSRLTSVISTSKKMSNRPTSAPGGSLQIHFGRLSCSRRRSSRESEGRQSLTQLNFVRQVFGQFFQEHCQRDFFGFQAFAHSRLGQLRQFTEAEMLKHRRVDIALAAHRRR